MSAISKTMGRSFGSAIALLLSGCLADLINIGEGPDDDRRKTERGGNGGDSGASATSGTGDAGGNGGEAPETGGSVSTGGSTPNGGAGARGGTSGSAGSGGKGGSGGKAGGGGVTTDPDVIARAAVVLGSCYPDDGVSRNAAELWHWRELSGLWSGFRPHAECIAEAGRGCAALDTCLGYAIEEAPGCTPGRTCENDRSTQCAEVDGVGTVAVRIDCSALDAQCDPRAVCVRGPAVECDATSHVEHCANESPNVCGTDPEGPEPGVVRTGPSCAELGLQCIAEATGDDQTVVAYCAGTGEPCEESDAFTLELFVGLACSGGTLHACAQGRRHALDCSTYGPGFSCQSYGGIPFCGLASECLPGDLSGSGNVSQQGDPEPACEGTSIVFCNAGRMERIDCTDFGFTGCDLEAGRGCVPSPESHLRPRTQDAR